MDEKQPSFEELQQILDENAQIIQIIMKCQSEGRMMDCLLYQTRLHLNLVQLASIADNRPHPSIGIKNTKKSTSQNKDSSKNLKVSAFIQAIKENGMSDLDLISEITSLPTTEVFDLCTSFIDFLKRQNRYSEADKYENDLKAYNNKIENANENRTNQNVAQDIKEEAAPITKEEAVLTAKEESAPTVKEEK